MNYRRPWRTILPLLVSLVILLGVMAPWGCGSGSSPSFTPAPAQANMAVAFIGSPPSGVPGFRNVQLNISRVRLNPIANAAPNDPRWVDIAIPFGVGNGSGPSPGDFQIDLNNIQTGATLFNIGAIPVGTYSEVQVVVDPESPGAIVPACQSQNVNLEGCASYPIAFSNPQQAVTVSLPSPIHASKGNLAILLLQLSLAINAPPAGPGGTYTVTVTVNTANPDSFLGLVTGTVHAVGSPQRRHVGPLSVSAELTGTDMVVATVPLTGDNFTLELPAFPGAGSVYDLFVSGGSFTFDAQRAITVYPGISNAPLAFNVAAAGHGTISGTITDACSGLGIPGAVVELLAPPSNVSPPVDCATEPQNCVAVAATSTDSAGDYPLPPMIRQPSGFNQVPTGKQNLAIQVSASGYGTLVASAEAGLSGGGTCAGSLSKSQCSFSLLTGYIKGTVTLSQAPPPGQSVQVEVLAENSGTNQLVSALTTPLVFVAGQTSALFTLNVPVPSPPGAAPIFDLFAAAIDPYLGATDPYPGHTIAVAPGVTGQANQCQTTSASLGPLDCAGHGSISGTVTNPDSGTTLGVLEDGVQILGTAPGLFSSAAIAPNNQFALCVPPGQYTLQRFEQPPGGGSPSPGASLSVAVPTPSAVSTPCPSTCSSASNGSSCPGQCFATQANL